MLKNVIKSKVKKGAKFAERKLDISTPATKLGRIGKTAGVGATYAALTSAFGSSNTSVTSGSFDNSTGGSSTFGFNKSSMAASATGSFKGYE
jgi:hypothetical protein